jgi:hypothetical protein
MLAEQSTAGTKRARRDGDKGVAAQRAGDKAPGSRCGRGGSSCCGGRSGREHKWSGSQEDQSKCVSIEGLGYESKVPHHGRLALYIAHLRCSVGAPILPRTGANQRTLLRLRSHERITRPRGVHISLSPRPVFVTIPTRYRELCQLRHHDNDTAKHSLKTTTCTTPTAVLQGPAFGQTLPSCARRSTNTRSL